MKPKQKISHWLLGALAITTIAALAGCEIEGDDHHRGGYGGYERGYGHEEHWDRDRDRGWDHERGDVNSGTAYAWQQPSPGAQVER